MDSILKSVKRIIGLSDDYTVFDTDLIIHINSVFGSLYQMGVGSDKPFVISGDRETWSDFLGGDERQEMVKSYVAMRVKLLFDPPTSSISSEAMKEAIREFEWRMHFTAEGDHMKDG